MVPRMAGSNTWLVGPGSHRKILESEPWSAKARATAKAKALGKRKGKTNPNPTLTSTCVLTTPISSYKGTKVPRRKIWLRTFVILRALAVFGCAAD
jgi:hypothetical protein